MKPVLGNSVLVIGPICLDELTFIRDGRCKQYPGGNAVITASTLAAMGVPTSILGVIGGDDPGLEITKHLENAGVDVSLLQVVHSRETKIGRNIVREDGSWLRDPKNDDPRIPYLPKAETLPNVKQFTHLHIGALNSLLQTTPETVHTILTAFRQNETSISIGLAGTGFDPSEVDQLLTPLDTILCTGEEFCHLVHAESRNIASLLSTISSARYQHCAVTLAELGALARHKRDIHHATAFGTRITDIRSPRRFCQIEEIFHNELATKPSVAATCSVGAGDVFAGIFLAGTLRGIHITRRLRAAARAASFSVLDQTWSGWLQRRHARRVHKLLHSES